MERQSEIPDPGQPASGAIPEIPDYDLQTEHLIPDNSEAESVDSGVAEQLIEPPAEAPYEPDLSTIEEQPELGYQSDSSDTEMIFPKGDVKKKGQQTNLPTLDEEDQKLLNTE